MPSAAPPVPASVAASISAAAAAVAEGPRIRVAVRKRPLNKKEKGGGETDIISVVGRSSSVLVHEPKTKVDLTKYVDTHTFVFDEVFGEEAGQADIYERTCRPLVAFFLNKGKATCFAYGQTGSGKTFTMMGPGGGKGEQAGLYVQATHDIFAMVGRGPYAGVQIWASFFEIYGGKLFDLLNARKKLECREDGQQNVVIVGIKERQVESVEQMMELIAHGNSVRSTGQTGANIDSSRSHAILQITAKKVTKANAPPKPMGKFSFIDLAGSERAADTTNNDRQTRLEGAEINKSLLALKECIRALDQGAAHRPFRSSKLTQVLKDSLVGNARTVMIANISPNSGSCEHTLNTLRYADRVRELKEGGAGSSAQNAYMPHRGNAGGIAPMSRVEEKDEGMSHDGSPVQASLPPAPPPRRGHERGASKMGMGPAVAAGAAVVANNVPVRPRRSSEGRERERDRDRKSVV